MYETLRAIQQGRRHDPDHHYRQRRHGSHDHRRGASSWRMHGCRVPDRELVYVAGNAGSYPGPA